MTRCHYCGFGINSWWCIRYHRLIKKTRHHVEG